MNKHLKVNDVFSERNVVLILVYLYVFGPRTRSEIYHDVSTNPRMSNKLQLLIDVGLVHQTEKDWYNRKELSLTEAGKKVAEYLISLEKQLGGSMDSFKWDVRMANLEDFS